MQEDMFGLFRDNSHEKYSEAISCESMQKTFRKLLQPQEYDLLSLRYGFQVNGQA